MLLEGVLVREQGDPLLCVHAEMMVAVRADVQVFLHVGREEQGVALGAFHPHRLGHKGHVLLLFGGILQFILRFYKSKKIHIFTSGRQVGLTATRRSPGPFV